MMLNAQIPLQGQPMQLEPRANALMRAMQMRGMQQDQQMRQAQMLKYQEAAQQSLMERQKAEEAAKMRDAALAQVQSGGRLDPVAMMRAGMDPKLIEFLANRENLGRPEVARTAEIAGPDGRPVTVQLDKFGRPVGDGMPRAVESKLIDLGGRQQAYDPYSLKPGQQLTKTMTPDGQAADARARASLAQSAAQHAERLAFDRMKEQNATKAGAKPMTDSQAKANLFGKRADEANKILLELEKEGVTRPGNIKSAAGAAPWVGGGLGTMMNWTQSEGQQQVEQAQRDFVNAVLRRESGAVINPEEFDNARKQYFPQIGDSEAVIKQKARNRHIAINGILAEVPTGSGSFDIPPAQGKNITVDY